MILKLIFINIFLLILISSCINSSNKSQNLLNADNFIIYNWYDACTNWLVISPTSFTILEMDSLKYCASIIDSIICRTYKRSNHLADISIFTLKYPTTVPISYNIYLNGKIIESQKLEIKNNANKAITYMPQNLLTFFNNDIIKYKFDSATGLLKSTIPSDLGFYSIKSTFSLFSMSGMDSIVLYGIPKNVSIGHVSNNNFLVDTINPVKSSFTIHLDSVNRWFDYSWKDLDYGGRCLEISYNYIPTIGPFHTENGLEINPSFGLWHSIESYARTPFNESGIRNENLNILVADKNYPGKRFTCYNGKCYELE